MLKKLLKIVRTLLIGALWTYAFLIFSQLLLWHIWRFNLFSTSAWQTIGWFWRGGGVIRTGADYLFLFSLLLLPFIWIIGWHLLTGINYLNLLLTPLQLYNRWIIRRFGHQSRRIVLRNLKSSQQSIEEIKQKLESIKPETPKEVGSIREEIQKKLETKLK